ncbi:hypothetical protein EAG_02071 [Camponotus floridanus]|uniref:BED-type domain-containing protein n=1 Tax=Camponotus floridanus TaxID=104421 RepID=E2A4C8_CAMFO|nr:hypothetical protein EAG_02071 [Camponotus floridanus]
MAKTPWKWNYFTLESLSKVECSLCNKVYQPKLRRTEALKNHIINKKEDPDHEEAYRDYMTGIASRLKKNVKKFSWDSHYEIISSDIILRPNVQCNHCKTVIPAPRDGKPLLEAPGGLSEHLKHHHNIELENWQAFEKWIYIHAKNYIPNITSQSEIVIKVRRCEKCETEIKAENVIMFVRHLIDKHYQEIQPLPADIIPKELLLDFDPDDKFGDIKACIENPDDKSDDVRTGTKDPADDNWETIDVPSTSTIAQPHFNPSQSGQSGSSQPSQSSQSSQSAGTSKKSPSKRKRDSSRQTKEHPSKRKKDSST